MSEGTHLCSRRINHGQSEIWLSDGASELSERRVMASNEVRNVVKRLCPDEFQNFYDELYARLEVVATLDCQNVSKVSTELRLK